MTSLALLVFLFGGIVLNPESVFAQKLLEVPLGNVRQVADAADYIAKLYTFVLGAAGIVSTVMIIWGGAQWLTSAGNARQIERAKESIRFSVIGLVLALLSYTVLTTINPALTRLQWPQFPVPNFNFGVSTDRLCSAAPQYSCGQIYFVKDASNNLVSCMGVWCTSAADACVTLNDYNTGDFISGSCLSGAPLYNRDGSQLLGTYDFTTSSGASPLVCGDVDPGNKKVYTDCARGGGAPLRSCYIETSTVDGGKIKTDPSTSKIVNTHECWGT